MPRLRPRRVRVATGRDRRAGAAMRTAGAVREKIVRIAAHLLEAPPRISRCRTAASRSRERRDARSPSPRCRVAHLETHRLPRTPSGPRGHPVLRSIRGTFAAGSQAAVVEVDLATGGLTIHRYVCVEDTGRIINPLIVEGQVQGAGRPGDRRRAARAPALRRAGQLLTGTFMEYAMPTAAGIPKLELHHVEDRPTTGGCARRGARAHARPRPSSPMRWRMRWHRSGSSRTTSRSRPPACGDG